MRRSRTFIYYLFVSHANPVSQKKLGRRRTSTSSISTRRVMAIHTTTSPTTCTYLLVCISCQPMVLHTSTSDYTSDDTRISCRVRLSFTHRSSVKFDSQLSNSYSKCLGDVQAESWRHVTKMSVKHEVVRKKKSDKDKRECIISTEQETSVGLKTFTKRKDFCCTLCDKYVLLILFPVSKFPVPCYM